MQNRNPVSHARIAAPFLTALGLLLAAPTATFAQGGDQDFTIPYADDPPPGLRPGEFFHLVFVTDDLHDATSDDINVYNAFVDQLGDVDDPDAAPQLNDWKAIASTATTSAFDNAAVQHRVFDTRGRKVANGPVDFWSASHIEPIQFDRFGNQVLPDPSETTVDVFTGSTPGGNPDAGRTLGAANVRIGNANASGTQWAAADNPDMTPSTLDSNTDAHFYAISDPIEAALVDPVRRYVIEQIDGTGSLQDLAVEFDPTTNASFDVTVSILPSSLAFQSQDSPGPDVSIATFTAPTQTDQSFPNGVSFTIVTDAFGEVVFEPFTPGGVLNVFGTDFSDGINPDQFHLDHGLKSDNPEFSQLFGGINIDIFGAGPDADAFNLQEVDDFIGDHLDPILLTQEVDALFEEISPDPFDTFGPVPDSSGTPAMLDSLITINLSGTFNGSFGTLTLTARAADTAAAVPEPASLFLLTLAGLPAIARRRARRTHRNQ